MIERYSSEEMRELFSLQHKFDTFLKVELACCHAFASHGVIPQGDYLKLKENASFRLQRVEELEKQTRHDVIAFTRAVSETLGEEKKWIHYQLTSTDVVDTANGVIFSEADAILKRKILSLIGVLKEKALLYKDTPCIGRTHGIHADITSFGLKFALYYDEMNRNYRRFCAACKDIEIGKISGAVGNFAHVPSFVQDEACAELRIASSAISTQVLQRDRHAYYLSVLCLISGTLEKIATEIRLLQQTEIHEAEEYFSPGQKGSSAMPHKRNPISCENICGCARMMRGYLIPAYEDIPLWHERDISHSSVERVALSDAIQLLDYMLDRMNRVVSGLIVYPERMKQNIFLTCGVIFSQRIVSRLIERGYSREEAYDAVQPLAQKSYNERLPFLTLVKEDKNLCDRLGKTDLEDLFSLEYYLKTTDEIYRRIGIDREE